MRGLKLIEETTSSSNEIIYARYLFNYDQTVNNQQIEQTFLLLIRGVEKIVEIPRISHIGPVINVCTVYFTIRHESKSKSNSLFSDADCLITKFDKLLGLSRIFF